MAGPVLCSGTQWCHGGKRKHWHPRAHILVWRDLNRTSGKFNAVNTQISRAGEVLGVGVRRYLENMIC